MDNSLNNRRQPNSQNSRILEHLQNGFSITPLEGFQTFGTMNLAQRIAQLRSDGYKIKDRWIENPNGRRFKEYWIYE